jgi:hypothetical protein
MKKYIILGVASFAVLLLAGCGQQTAPADSDPTPSGNSAPDKKEVSSKAEPNYSKYFNSITINKTKMGLPPFENLPVESTEFNASTDLVQIDFDSKESVLGEAYYELVDSANENKIITTENNKLKILGGKNGTNFQIPAGSSGDFKINVYFNTELVFTIPIKVSK